MKRLLSIAGSLLGLLALIVLVLALALTFGGLRRGAEPVSWMFQSPIETPTQPPYPPPAPPSKPTPVTPPPTIPPKPSPPTVTVTFPPYPPPQTPTPPGTPTSVPTPRATVTPPAPGTPTAVPTPSGPLPPGPKVVYGETDSTSGTTTIWLASPMNPQLRRVLITLAHKSGYGVQGAVSPDGNKIAYLVIPPDTSERAARTAGGELWVMNSDGTNPRRIAGKVGYIGMWAPNSQVLVYGRLLSQAPPAQEPIREELYVLDLDGTQNVIVSEERAYIAPLGWSPDSRKLFYLRREHEHAPELWTAEIATKVMHPVRTLPSNLASGISFSPQKTHLLFSTLEQREPSPQYALMIAPVEAGPERIVLRGATGDKPINRYAAIWSPDGQSILAHIPPQPGEPAHLERIDLTTGQTHTVPVETVSGGEFFIPRSYSPDGEWLVVLKYPQLQSLAYLMRATGGSMVRIPLAQPSNWITLLGWTD